MKFKIFQQKIIEKNPINFIYSIDRIMDFNRAEPTCYRTNFPYASSDLQNGAFSYIVLRVMRLTYTRGLIRLID